MSTQSLPGSPDRANDFNVSNRIDIALSYCGKMTLSNAYPSPDPGNSTLFVYGPSANMFEAGLQSSPGVNSVDTASPVHLFAPTSSVGSPAPSVRSTSTAGPYPATSPPAPSSKSKVCSVCKKTFSRRCDLNRHNKTHDRPFKCRVEGCEYQTRGFPTDQERRRHVNDRHSDAPAIYSCTSEDCSYSSKRESNLKQHKEKAHGWTYDRSRPSNRSRAGQSRGHAEDDGQASFMGTSPSPAQAMCLPQTPAPSQAGLPFAGSYFNLPLGFQSTSLLDHQHDSANALFITDLDMCDITPVHVAWEEPATENQLGSFLLSTESQLASFPTTHNNRHNHHTQQAHVLTPHSWTPTTPELLSPAHSARVPVVPATPYLGQHPFAGPVTGMPFARYPMVPSTSLPMRQAVPAGDTSQAAGPHTTQRSVESWHGTQHRNRNCNRNCSSFHLIPSTDIPFDGNSMPCPLRITDPDFYSRGTHARNSSCHTRSTLLAAHSLVVDKDSASSFGIGDSFRPHGSPAPPEAAQNKPGPDGAQAAAAAFPALPQASPQLYDNSRRLQEIMQPFLGCGQQSNRLGYRVSSPGRTTAGLVGGVSFRSAAPAYPGVDFEMAYDSVLTDMDWQKSNISSAAAVPHTTSIHHD